jgi:hypothetical protein
VAAGDFDDMVALLRRNTDEFGWLQPLLDDPSSRAALGGAISVFARLSEAAIHNRDAALITAASGGQHGSCNVVVARADDSTAGTIPKGYQFTDERGVQVVTQTDVPVAAGTSSVSLPCQTVRQSELVNTVDPPVFTATGPSIPDSGGTVPLIAPPSAPAFAVTTFAVSSATPIHGGAADYLSVHGNERGMKRQPGESESDYRARIRNVPDAVSPIAVGDVVAAASQFPGLPPFQVLEPFADGADPVKKELHRLGSFEIAAYDAAADGSADFLDDLGGPEMADRRSVRAYFRVEAGDYVRDVGSGAMFLDDGYFDDPVLGYSDAWINFPPYALGAILSMVDSARVVKAGGVNFDTYLKNGDVFFGAGQTSSSFVTNVFAISPPAGSSWLMVEATVGHDAPAPIAGARHQLQFSFLGGDTYTTPWYSGADTQRIPVVGRLVTQIVGVLQSDGTNPLHLVGQFRAHQLAAYP